VIIKAEGKDTVVLTDIVFLCKSVEMHNFLTKSGCESRYINPTPFGMMVMRALESECFVLVGEFSEEEITLVRARCRPVMAKRVLVVAPSLTPRHLIMIQEMVGRHVNVVVDNFGRDLLPEPEEKQEEPVIKPDHSYKAVRERNKFFR
jgi:hypothetical protein